MEEQLQGLRDQVADLTAQLDSVTSASQQHVARAEAAEMQALKAQEKCEAVMSQLQQVQRESVAARDSDAAAAGAQLQEVEMALREAQKQLLQSRAAPDQVLAELKAACERAEAADAEAHAAKDAAAAERAQLAGLSSQVELLVEQLGRSQQDACEREGQIWTSHQQALDALNQSMEALAQEHDGVSTGGIELKGRQSHKATAYRLLPDCRYVQVRKGTLLFALQQSPCALQQSPHHADCKCEPLTRPCPCKKSTQSLP